ncbi:MAG: PBSX family phage terminase large subunit [Firmicutes bacterium]|nr:PBSX family phage terminase large subunit [Bacillota bacterium]
MISEKQLKILAFPYTKYEAIICDGAIRSGKSSIMMWAFVKWGMMNFDGQRFAICGKSVDSCIKNVIQPFLAMSLARETYRLRWRRIDKVLEVQNGNTTNLFEVFGGKDESSFALIQGRTLAGVLLDEVALQPRSFVEQALARCSVSGSRFWFNCNPGPPSHWFYQEWIKQTERHKALHLHFLLEDNPALDPEIVERYKNTYAGVFYRRYILGEWCVADGLVYPMFDKAKHVATEQHSGGVYYISIDYGTLNPTAMGLWQLRNGKAVMLKEYYYDGRKQKRQKTDEEYADDLEAFAEGYQIERVIVDPSAASFKETLRRRGKFAVMDANNAVLDGIRLTGSLLLAGRILFDASCENTFDEFGSYCWDEKKETDAVVKESDHAMDMIRYFVYTIMRREVR